KTLNLSMLRYFFEKTKKDTSHLFTSLKIWKLKKYREFQGQFPVIFLSLKDLKQPTWKKAIASMADLISDEFERHKYLLKALSPKDKERFQKLNNGTADQQLLEKSLFYLSKWLHEFHKKKAILLIDEYDTPVHVAYLRNYYDPMIDFLRNWLSAGLKDNNSL